MSEERELAVIARIEKLSPIEGKDRIELATVENYNVIVQKGEYEVGDLCVYIFYDVILPQKEEFEFLRSRCFSPKFDGFRIREMKMAGVFSSGIVFPISILPSSVSVKEGVDVGEVLEVVKYDPEALAERRAIAQKKDNAGPILKFLLKFKIMRKLLLKNKKAPIGYPDRVEKSNETNIQKNFNQLKSSGDTFIVTEKMEGQSSLYCLVPKGKSGKKVEYRFYSHNAIRYAGDGSNWGKISSAYSMENRLRHYKGYTGVNLGIEGEICGPGIQGNIYGFDSLQYFVFRIYDVDTGRIFSFKEMQEALYVLGLTGAPVIDALRFTEETTIENLLDYADSEKSTFGETLREGIVLTSKRDPWLRAKVKGPKYKEWFGKKYDITI